MAKDNLVEAAKDAVGRVFCDRRCSPETTIERLEDIQSHIEANIEALKADAIREDHAPEGDE